MHIMQCLTCSLLGIVMGCVSWESCSKREKLLTLPLSHKTALSDWFVKAQWLKWKAPSMLNCKIHYKADQYSWIWTLISRRDLINKTKSAHAHLAKIQWHSFHESQKLCQMYSHASKVCPQFCESTTWYKTCPRCGATMPQKCCPQSHTRDVHNRGIARISVGRVTGTYTVSCHWRARSDLPKHTSHTICLIHTKVMT